MFMSKRTRITDATIEHVWKLYEQGMDCAAIAMKLKKILFYSSQIRTRIKWYV